MGTSARNTEPSGLLGNFANGLVPTVVPVAVAKSISNSSAEPDVLTKIIDRAEASMREHFEALRISLQQLQSSERIISKPEDGNRRATEQILQAERERMDHQRGQEQEQVRATMQQLADAWLKLEREQLAQASLANDQSRQSAVQDPARGDCQRWQLDQMMIDGRPQINVDNASLTDLELQQTVATSANCNSTDSEALFHKLRLDLMKQSSIGS